MPLTSSIYLPAGKVGHPYAGSVIVKNENDARVPVSINQWDQLPNGLVMDSVGNITGTPTAPKADAVHFTASSTLTTGTNHQGTPYEGMELVFEDQFTGSSLDTTKWGYYDLGPRKDAVNVPEAIQVRNGNLEISLKHVGNEIHTGIIGTHGKHLFTYGYYEVRFKPMDIYGAWAAAWIQSPTIYSGQDPEVAGVEIDLEFLKRYRHLHCGMHWGNYVNGVKKSQLGGIWSNPPNNIFDGAYHTAGVLWTKQGYTFYLDGEVAWTAPSWVPVSRAEQFLLLSVESTSWGNSTTSQHNPPLTVHDEPDAVAYFDYFKVYQNTGSGGSGQTSNETFAYTHHFFVSNAYGPDDLSISGTPPPAKVGEAYMFKATVRNRVAPHGITMTGNQKPSWMTVQFNHEENVVEMFGIPDRSGRHTYTFEATDSVRFFIGQFDFIVEDADYNNPEITVVGQEVTYTMPKTKLPVNIDISELASGQEVDVMIEESNDGFETATSRAFKIKKD